MGMVRWRGVGGWCRVRGYEHGYAGRTDLGGGWGLGVLGWAHWAQSGFGFRV